ncbi:hypothetical protein SAMN05421666_2783 [Roseovarius nanhaiticus]|uniref:Uncharacterized protein n=1 Tax=Roseovarius nanhaiticus TaxID=573024 RepID=A0A1N7HD67_9RHOB|nr:hypothetical protein SAMN05216208_2532 [Roseovarius nanhaiticus]SIS22805.1 hypothetical protein SAMN05421666_2783 [Roseovarius nanhaiticus]
MDASLTIEALEVAGATVLAPGYHTLSDLRHRGSRLAARRSWCQKARRRRYRLISPPSLTGVYRRK